MIRARSSLCLLLLTLALCIPGLARADVVVQGNTKVPLYGMADLTAVFLKEGEKTQYLWKVSSGTPVKVVTLGKRILFSGPPGTYKLSCTVVDFKAEILTGADVTVVIGGKGPDPEPGPTPDPEPGPKPDPTPIPLMGYRVLIVYESAELPKLPAAKTAILYAKTIRDYLNTKCVVGADQKTKEFRIWDKDVDASSEAVHWQNALKRKRESVPWIIVSNGVTGYEGPLPANVDETLALLKKYEPAMKGGK